MERLVFDVIVVGSGAAGMLAAVRAADAGLRAVVLEKSHRYGGTSAVSGGGIWVPNNFDIAQQDSPEAALTYLRACTDGSVADERLIAFIDNAPKMAEYLKKVGVGLTSIAPLPDYLSRLPGAIRGRTLAPGDVDGKTLGQDYFKLREPYSYLQLLGRLSINNAEAGILGAKAPGWRKLIFRLMKNYWLDLGWRRRTRRDRRLCNGQALVGGLRKAMQDRDIPLMLGVGLDRLVMNEAKAVVGVQASRNGQLFEIQAERGVVLASGGFESNQPMRDRHLDGTSSSYLTAAPVGINTGDAITTGKAIGAKLSHMDLLWKAPVLRLPAAGESNVQYCLPFFWERAAPGSICVNRLGKRFVNEAVSYDEFGAAMLADQATSGANLPCWMIFDATCRHRSLIGPLMPGEMVADGKLPPDWEGSVFFRATGLRELGEKIGIDGEALSATVAAFNADALVGKDSAFDRGGSIYDQFFGDAKVKPNPTMAPLEAGPFYAIRLDLGDLGTKGGLETDISCRVQGEDGPIAGLYATGNCSASIFANAYPGAGGTLGPALTGAILAVDDIARQVS